MGQIKFFASGVMLAFIFLTFQNCAKKSSSSTDEVTGQTYNRVDASSFTLLKVNEVALVQDLALKSSSSGSASYRVLEIDLNNGTVYIIDSSGQKPGEMYTLKGEDQINLKNILAASEICEPVEQRLPADTVCTTIYEFPYVELADGSTIKKLGERASGCAVPADLCDDKAKIFKDYLQDILRDTAARTF